MYPSYARKWGGGTGRGAYSKGRLFDIMVLGVGAHLGEVANKSISAYSRT